MLAEWLTLFKSLGFSDTETKVYLACLELGPAAVQDIAKKAKVSRVATYGVIETLTDRGLMSSFMKEKRKRFVVESPERLISYAEGRIKHAEDAVVQAKEVMEDLKAIQKGERPIVRIFEGVDALRNIQQDIIESGTSSTDEIGNFDEIDKIYNRSKEIKPYLEKLDKQKINSRLIILRRKKPDPSVRSQIVGKILLNPDEHDFKGDVVLYGDKIAFSTFKGKQVSIIIENRDLARTIKALFDLIFKKKN